MSKNPADSTSSTQGLPFEDILTRLHQVVERLEKGDLPLEESIAVFEEGVRLSRLGNRRLDEAERKVEILLNQQDNQTVPFEEATKTRQ